MTALASNSPRPSRSRSAVEVARWQVRYFRTSTVVSPRSESDRRDRLFSSPSPVLPRPVVSRCLVFSVVPAPSQIDRSAFKSQPIRPGVQQFLFVRGPV